MPSYFETPILFLIFNRPDVSCVVFDQLKKAKPKRLFVAADGPRYWVPGEKEKCEETRKIINSIGPDCEVKTLFRDNNLGCRLAVSSAISWFFNEVEEGIILEDDCYPDLSFLPYCQQLLIKYRDVEEVKLIGGNNFQNGIMRGPGSYYFSHYPEIWGWASWRRAWQQYNLELSDVEETFASGSFDDVFKTKKEREYWFQKFLQTKNGEIDTWDYQLTYSILKNGGIAITPQVNLVKNIGLHNNPTHASLADSKKTPEMRPITFPLVHPQMIVDKTADHYTFAQIYSKSFHRIVRLVRENGLKKFLFYTLNHLFK
ncbi:MAG TPA: hypothetical protein VM884_06135 [Flavisolibacter sp.]|nr:hypothetical protein [Flavisolibacter sp.]